MTIKALVYGGVQIGNFNPLKAHKSFDGVWMELRGSTFKDGRWEPAGLTLEMSQADALDMAMALFLAAEDHSEYARKAPANFVKRLAKRMARKERPEMQPCAGRNCGSTNPNLHSAECFEDYEKATGMNQWQGLTDEEIKEIVGPWGDTPIKGYTRKLFDQIDAKLREKNA